MNLPRTAEPLFQTPDQKISGTITFRVYLDGAYRNIDAPQEWKSLPHPQLFSQIEERYYSTKFIVKAV